MYELALIYLSIVQRQLPIALEETIRAKEAPSVSGTKEFTFNGFPVLIIRTPPWRVGETNCIFPSALRCHRFKFSLPCPMAHSAKISAENGSTFTDEEVQMFPFWMIAWNQSMTLQSYDIVFLSISSMPRWLRILYNEEAYTYFFQVCHRKRSIGYEWMLGGIQRNLPETSISFNMLPILFSKGRSGPFDERSLPSLKMARAQEDDMKSSFHHTFK